METVNAYDLDFTARIFDETGVLQSMSVHCNACSPHTQHFSQKILSEVERIAAG
jgi:hypothetical protein